jgi:23S rRNA (guanosine2251-2'-O)-methyltransferase
MVFSMRRFSVFVATVITAKTCLADAANKHVGSTHWFPYAHAIPGFVFPRRSTRECSRICATPQGGEVQDDASARPIEYQSRSTSSPEASTQFHVGADDRRARLHAALQDIGVQPGELVALPEFRGSAALRTYSSFVLPKSEGALAMTEQPQRATVVANNISFLVREHRSHQQEWLRNHDRSLQEAEELFLDKKERNPISLVLDDIRSAHNVGNILRLAEAARCEQVVLCGSMTPSPPHPKVLKTALGAAEYVPYQTVGSTLEAVRDLKQQGVRVFGVETTSRSVSLWQVNMFDSSPQGRVAFVFGNELVGVDTTVLEACDGIVSVPTHGVKNSLNVATCASVVTWEALRQWDIMQQGNTHSTII